jgi:hypothetical protein
MGWRRFSQHVCCLAFTSHTLQSLVGLLQSRLTFRRHSNPVPGALTVILDEEWGVNNPSEDQNRHKAIPLHYQLHDLQRFVPVPRHIPPQFGAI